MNNWNIAGRIGNDAELRTTPGGHVVTQFSVAVDQRQGGEKTTLWVSCSLWGKRAEALAQYLTKGTVVSVAGEASARTWDDKGGKTHISMGCNVQQITLLGGGQKREDAATKMPERMSPSEIPRGGLPQNDDSDLPF